jgi:hypothetical protein
MMVILLFLFVFVLAAAGFPRRIRDAKSATAAAAIMAIRLQFLDSVVVMTDVVTVAAMDEDFRNRDRLVEEDVARRVDR